MKKIFCLLFFGIFETQNRKVSILFYVHKGPKIKNKIKSNFSILGLKNVKKKAENIFLTYTNLWTTKKFGFQDQLFMKKRRQFLRGVLFSRCRSKTPILAKINFF